MAQKRKPIPQGVRFDVFRRDDFTCVYCGAKSPDATLHCDHKLAVANGGTDDISNLVTACADCNYGKGVKKVKMATRRTAANDNGLVGLYGHTRTDDGEIQWQFEVTGMVGDDACTIQLFSWMDGRPTDVRVMSVEDMSACSLYSSRDEWIWQWAKESAASDGKGDRWARKTFRFSTGREFGDAA